MLDRLKSLWMDNADFRTRAIRSSTLLHDFLFATLSVYIAIFVAGHDALTKVSSRSIFIGAILFGLISTVIGAALGLNRGIWRYASVYELRAILASAVMAAALWTMSLLFLQRLQDLPRTIIVLTVAFYCLLIGGSRLAFRTFRDELKAQRQRQTITSSAIFLGPADLADVFLRWASDRQTLHYSISGIVDPRGRRAGRSIRGVPVLGGLDILQDLLQRHKHGAVPLKYLIVAPHRSEIDREQLTRIVDLTAQFGLRVLKLPDLSDVDGASLAPQPFDVMELLPRPTVRLDFADLSNYMVDETILITGAGGSIGSELCRQAMALKPRRLVLVDHSETHLFNVWQSLKEFDGKTEIAIHICDIRDGSRVLETVSKFAPSIIFHAAALKHVPFVEAQPLEGLHTNAIGTRNIADAAVAAGVRGMVMISTDKAVRPTSIMGATKRMAEIYCQSLDVAKQTRFVVVRFGNVLGSAGSIVPLFRSQLEKGGPLTVTHPLVERFFMTIPEAAQLVLHASRYAMRPDSPRGLIYGLDMGKPVRIMDLARRLIQLAGLRPDIDIEIKITGLRPGEKLYEEVFAPDETPTQAAIPGILTGHPASVAAHVIERAFSDLERAIAQGDSTTAMAVLRELVVEYVVPQDLNQQFKLALTPELAAPPSGNVINFQRP